MSVQAMVMFPGVFSLTVHLVFGRTSLTKEDIQASLPDGSTSITSTTGKPPYVMLSLKEETWQDSNMLVSPEIGCTGFASESIAFETVSPTMNRSSEVSRCLDSLTV